MVKFKNTLVSCTAAAICCLLLASCNGTGNSNSGTEERAKYIFVMIGDGMGLPHAYATESYLSWKNDGQMGGQRLVYSQFPVIGLCTTYSANNDITDSAASGTAIATGHKTLNSMLGMGPDSTALTSMAYTLKGEGYKVGIMSSVPVNHATPGAFYAHQINRNLYYDISLEIPQTDFDFFAGSGLLQFDGKRHDKEPIDKVLAEQGYPVFYGLEEFKGCEDKDGVIVVQESAKSQVLNYEIEKEAKEDRLGEVVAAAIDYLGDEEPFFIMCEGGEIDWAAHDNSTMEMIDAVLRFNEAVEVAYNFYLQHPDETLIVVTADHETGALTIGADSSVNPDHNKLNWEGLEAEYANSTEKFTREQHREIARKYNIGWNSVNHTGCPVPVYAIGKGAEKFAGRMDNEDIYGKVVGE